MTLVKRVTGEGKTVRRVRVITEPHSRYVGWGHSLTHLNLEAGEDIRWLPRHHVPEGITLPVDGNDWWLYDDRLLAVGHFDPEGRVLETEIVEEPENVAECSRMRDFSGPQGRACDRQLSFDGQHSPVEVPDVRRLD